MGKLYDDNIVKPARAKVATARTVKTLPRAAVKAAVHRGGSVSRETGRPAGKTVEPASPVTTAAGGGRVPPEAPGEVTSEGPGYGKPFLLQVTVRQEERLEEERRILGFRSRAETIRYYLEIALKQAAKGRLE